MKTKIIGLTGATGSGKSTAADLLKELGCAVIDADVLARDALKNGSACLKQLQAVFGNDIIDENGVNRQLLAKRAFSSPENTQLLNDITHPWIFLQMLKELKKYRELSYKYVVFDAPLLFESNADAVCAAVISVVTPMNLRLERIMKRDNITKEAAIQRMSVQHDDEFFRKNSDYIIDGEQSCENIKLRLKEILDQMESER